MWAAVLVDSWTGRISFILSRSPWITPTTRFTSSTVWVMSHGFCALYIDTLERGFFRYQAFVIEYKNTGSSYPWATANSVSCEKSVSLACCYVTGRDCLPGSAFIWARPLFSFQLEPW